MASETDQLRPDENEGGNRLRLSLIKGIPVLLVASLAYSFWPRHADLRGFDPAAVAHLETAMWRDYYQHRYAALFGNLYRVSRDQYRFSPWDSLRLAWNAAKAAKVFQPTHNRAEAQRALPSLERYYQVMRNRAGERFDVAQTAAKELDWWQLRREKATPAQYGAVIADVITSIYGVHNDRVLRSAVLRAEMMDYRDARSSGLMTSDDWNHIERGLVRSYELLKGEVKRSGN
jgi:hypothetical protein